MSFLRKIGPDIDLTHLQFVDDTRMWGEPTVKEVTKIINLLDCYITAIGQLLNKGKSKVVLFNVEKRERERIIIIRRFVEASLPLEYLGIPLSAKSLKSRD